MVRRGDIIPVSDEHNDFNRRNGLPRYRVQEVLAVLEPGERACDHGIHEPVWGYLNDGEHRVVVNNSVGSRVSRDRFFWPFKHDAVDPPPSEYAEVRYTTTEIVMTPNRARRNKRLRALSPSTEEAGDE